MTNDVEIIVERKQLAPYYTNTATIAANASVGALTIQVTISPVNVVYWQIGNYFFLDATSDDGYIIDKQNVGGNVWEITMSSGLPNAQVIGDLMKVKPFIAVEERLDLYENESISQNWNFTDIGDFKTIGGYSREFRIPLTDRNQSVFGSISDVNYFSSQGADNFYFTRLPSEIRVNTLPIVKGHMRVMRTYKQLDRLTDIEVCFYSETSDLVRIVGDKKLSDLTNLFALNHSITKAVCTQSPFLNDFFYFLADRGQKWDESGTINTRPITNSQYPVTLGDLTPAVKWSWIFEQILTDAGYTYDAPTLFSILENYWMPWLNRQTYLNPNQFIFLAQLTANQSYSSGDYLDSTNAFVNNDGVYSGDMFTTPFAGVYGFEIFTTVYLAQIAPFLNGRIVEVYLSDTSFLQDYLVGTFTNNGGNLETFSSVFVYQYFFPANTHLRIKYKIYNSAYVELTGVPHTFVFNSLLNAGTGWRLILAQLETDGLTVFMDTLAPDVKQIDFLRDVIKMHNLAVITDRNLPTRISFIPMSEYINSGNVKDWTGKLDISKDTVLESTTDLQKRNLSFTYTAGTDVTSKAFVDAAGRVFGEYKIDGYITNQQTLPNPFAVDNVEVKLTCESSPAQNIEGTNLPIQKFIDGNGNFVLPKMRCLYYAGQIAIQLSDGSSTTNENVATLNNYSNYTPTILDYDLNFAPETPLHYIVSNPYNNLFNLYWREYLDSIYSPEARILTAYFALDLGDVLTFEFNDKIWIKDSYWRILEIQDYKIGKSESTQVKLLKITNSTSQCDVIPVGYEDNGSVIWNDSAGNVQNGTRVCCERYGWYWSADTGTCFANVATDSTGGTDTIQASSTGSNPDTTTFPTNSLKSLISSSIDQSSSFSVFAGNKINIGANNVGTLAVGRNLQLDADKRGAALVGKNVLAKTSGFHLGGGWLLDDTNLADGGVQFGVVMFSGKDSILSSMGTMPLYIEGINGNHIELENATSQICVMTLNITYGIFNAYAIFYFRIEKDAAGVCTASTPWLSYSETTGAVTVNLLIDTITNPSQHQIYLEANGTGFPHGFIVSASLQYTQLR